MFWGLVASSATICTNCVLAFWYCSNTEERDPVEVSCGSRRQPSRVPVCLCHTLQHLPLAHGAAPASSGAGAGQIPGPPPPLGRTVPLCIRLQGNRPQPDTTASKGRDVTARVRKGTLSPAYRVAPAWVVRVSLGWGTVRRHSPLHTDPEWLVWHLQMWAPHTVKNN